MTTTGDKGKEKEGQLPAELDFFKYTQGGAPKRKVAESDAEEGSDTGTSSKKRSRHDSAEGGGDANDSREEGPSMPRHRVTSKGTNVPSPTDSFKELQERYDLPSRILQNLNEFGYKFPTAIQSHAAPILLEVLLF